MKKISYLIGLFVFTICLVSCEDEIPIKDLGIKPKLVLHCFISPQYDTIAVSLSRSQSIFQNGTTSAEVEYAVVEISNNNKSWIQIPYSTENNCYLLPQSQFPIVEGKTYYIRASSPNYESISASCTVPFWREVDLKPKREPDSEYGIPVVDNTLLLLSWQDYPNEKNYYAFMECYDVRFDDEFYSSFDYIEDENRKVVFSDEGKDGQRMNVLIENIKDYLDLFFFYDSVYILAIQTDRNCFLYENSVYSYASGYQMEDFESVFMLEPSLVYNNIKNGYGVFGALTFKPYIVNFIQKTVEEVEIPRQSFKTSKQYPFR